MHVKFAGDSYDIVKQSLLRVLGAEKGTWSVHPMFTEGYESPDVRAYERLLGCKVLSRGVLTNEQSTRNKFRDEALKCERNLFLDPDTGLRIQQTKRNSETYVFGDELLAFVQARPKFLTLIFDQSLQRGDKFAIPDKLAELKRMGLDGFTYCSHACFVIVGTDPGVVATARKKVLTGLRIPENRLIPPYPDNWTEKDERSESI